MLTNLLSSGYPSRKGALDIDRSVREQERKYARLSAEGKSFNKSHSQNVHIPLLVIFTKLFIQTH
jgi:hypothetical protein